LKQQYISLFQRALSIVIGLAILGVLFGLLMLGVIFFWYALAVGAIVYVCRGIYKFFKNKPLDAAKPDNAPFEPGHVEQGDFRRGPGRIIEHGDDETRS
jgi:hypothetical protein